MRKYLLPFFVVVSLVASSCKTSFDDPNYNEGTADFTRYVAVGCDFTAGFADSALYLEAQQNSFPAILASKFSIVGSDAFLQPLVNAGNGTGIDASGNVVSKLILATHVSCTGETFPDPVPASASGDASNIFCNPSPALYGNTAVPGMKSFQLLNTEFGRCDTLGSPFYIRFATNPGNSTVAGDAALNDPTFFTLWIGFNDVYAYALSGGKGLVGGMDANDITPADTFSKSLDAVIAILTSNGSSGMIANIPMPESFPFFTTIPYNGLILSSDTAAEYTASFGGLLGNFSEGSNAYIVVDAATQSPRKIKSTEYITLACSSENLRCKGLGKPWNPIPDHYVVDENEKASIINSISSFNNKISQVAAVDSSKVTLVDMKSFFSRIKNGYVFNGVHYDSRYLYGGFFSLDAIHPSQRGYALIANEWIAAINEKYGSLLPYADANNFPGILFP